MSVPLLGMFCPCGYSHIACIHFISLHVLILLWVVHIFYAGLIRALLGVRLGFLCHVCVLL